MRPFLAPSLVRLRREVDTAWPARSKASDGWIGNAAHQARKSEHNPDDRGVVHAIDVTAVGIDVKALLRAVVGHPGVWYVIHDGVIWSRTHGWKARRYTGPNPHRHHVHISIMLTHGAENVPGGWLARVVHEGTGDLRSGDRGQAVTALQKALGVDADGVFGPGTESALNQLKSAHDLPEDGVAGPRVRSILGLT